jgi:hypothetical protein
MRVRESRPFVRWSGCLSAALLMFGLEAAQAQDARARLGPPVHGADAEIVQVQEKLPPIDVVAPKTPPVIIPETPGVFGGGIPWPSGSIRSDTDRVGPYNQPAWTTQRPFSTTRSYVLPPGTMDVEQWVRTRWRREGKPEFRILEELTVGLPGRFQLDLYERWHIEPGDTGGQKADHEGVQIELRWALADWGVIPLNPTLYGEWVQRGRKNEPNVYEFKLLLSEELTDKLFWSANFVVEQETAGARETELAFSQALSVPLIERKLLGGVEMLLKQNTVHGERGDPEWSFLIGPSMQWRPTNRTFLNVTPLFGTTRDAPLVEMYVIFGFQFGNRAGPSGIDAPASTRGL